MRIARGKVIGDIEFRNALNKRRKLREPTINWPALGSVSIGEAKSFANDILFMCPYLENITILEREQGEKE